MGEIFRSLVWFFVISCGAAYAIFLFAGSVIHADAINASHIISARDIVEPGVHHLTGMVMVPRTCAELSVSTEYVSTTTFELRFKTWDEPSIECVTEDTPRVFHAVAFGPAAGVQFVASLDGEPLMIVVQQQKALRD